MTDNESPAIPALQGVPAFWPMALAASLLEQETAVYAKGLKFLSEEMKIRRELRPELATANTPRLDLRTMVLRDYGPGGALPTLIDAPYAGHTAVIADFREGQSLVATLLANGIRHVALTDWKSATPSMKDFEIDNYLADMIVAIDDLGGRVNLVGLCQGGWLSAMIAARFPEKVNALVLAGSPIDTDAGNGPVKRMAQGTPLSFYRNLVALGGGLMRGSIMLRSWKNMHPEQHYFQEHIDLYEHIDDPAYLEREEAFKAWYETPVDLPGRWYLQVIEQIFQQNRLAKGGFIGLGRKLSLRAITCPLYLLAGAGDDITTPEQALSAKDYVGTKPENIVESTVPGGHVGLFMGTKNLKNEWPKIAKWIADRSR